MVGLLAGIIGLVITCAVGFALLVAAMTGFIWVLSAVMGIATIAIEGLLWLGCWILELEVRKTWQPWKYWNHAFDYPHWWDALEERGRKRAQRREYARVMCKYCGQGGASKWIRAPYGSYHDWDHVHPACDAQEVAQG